MKLRELLKNAGVKTVEGAENWRDTEITGITLSSLEVKPGFLFIAIKGNQKDGHSYAASSVSRGAAAVAVERISDDIRKLGVPVAITQDSRLAAAAVAANFYHNPSSEMKVVGITGTNGKTTVTHMVEAIWKLEKKNVGLLGTIENRYMGESIPSILTTLDQVKLMKTMSEMRDLGVTNLVLEVSSHALDLKRVDSCHFDVAVFTNLTQDHLDYHITIENYFRAKQRFFTEILEKSEKQSTYAVINADDPFADKIPAPKKGQRITFSTRKENCDIFAKKFALGSHGITATLATPWGEVEINSKLMGLYNLYNMMAATAAVLPLGSSPEIISQALSGLAQIPGRLEKIENNEGINIFVDYAHTPDALENVLKCLTPFCTQRLITVVGSGGERDRGKRPLMAATSREYSDLLILTSDNPRKEDPQSIIADMAKGVEATDPMVIAIIDRGQAIKYAVDEACAGDIVLIAGKGHEDYQIIGDEKICFSDRETVKKYLNKKSGARH